MGSPVKWWWTPRHERMDPSFHLPNRIFHVQGADPFRWNTFPIESHIGREIRDRAKLRHRGAKSGQGWEGMHPLWPRGIRVRRQVMHRLLRENRDAILRIARKHGVDSIRVFGSFARDEAGSQSD